MNRVVIEKIYKTENNNQSLNQLIFYEIHVCACIGNFPLLLVQVSVVTVEYSI
jgi:hypothetical protein